MQCADRVAANWIAIVSAYQHLWCWAANGRWLSIGLGELSSGGIRAKKGMRARDGSSGPLKEGWGWDLGERLR